MLVPHTVWPSEQCAEHGGAGWTGRIGRVSYGTVSVSFKLSGGVRETVHFNLATVLAWQPLK